MLEEPSCLTTTMVCSKAMASTGSYLDISSSGAVPAMLGKKSAYGVKSGLTASAPHLVEASEFEESLKTNK